MRTTGLLVIVAVDGVTLYVFPMLSKLVESVYVEQYVVVLLHVPPPEARGAYVYTFVALV